ncbi:hypothetical protein CONPUDRAFT_117634 [Coniophora puteana RWD-64-598 SS2]|uniref:Uncharacterized protein n=1 Tax=Coniophora puteana (strain RWD-64-598) TaxID=741705 RepID=A0A5M3N135_CONPW|nr:uncharacterized protein CONPUDRAFT_117634 [Coniophora puteana RWD-64-598 SS2]EIW85112.1 hypothetical protein CONPUDRAFT_117634 [Coniophora puteana RWD-64-598 SS2]
MSRDELSESRRVNEILRNLRGEQYRHHRNINRARTDILPSSLTHNTPSLPTNLVYSVSQGTERPDRLAGPDPPRSWATNPLQTNVEDRIKPGSSGHGEQNSAEFRADALSLVIPGSTSLVNGALILPLTTYCLDAILRTCSQRDMAQIAEYIPAHLRRYLVRLAAIRSPLSDMVLNALRDEGEYVDGECVIVGPHGVLQVPQDDHPRIDRNLGKMPLQHHGARGDSWESSLEAPGPTAPHTFAIISLPLTTSKFLSLPPTITRLALIDVSTSLPIRRLHLICPLLAVLDLSYNVWLSTPEAGSRLVKEVDWSKLRNLEILGLRDCYIAPDLRAVINRGSWRDVQIVV